MAYKLNRFGSVVRVADDACIPIADGNRDYAEYLDWLAEGNEPAPYLPSADEIAKAAQQSTDVQAQQSAKMDVVIQYIVSHTPEECAQYVMTNVTDLASAKNMLAKMAMAISVLARKDLR